MSFGLFAAAWNLAQNLQIVSLIDRHVPKRQQGASVGQHLLLAALNRLASPNSKAQMLSWYQNTTLPRLFPLAPKQLRSQRFWDAMDAVDESALSNIESALSQRLIQQFGIDTSCSASIAPTLIPLSTAALPPSFPNAAMPSPNEPICA
jgi:hypothetical protein